MTKLPVEQAARFSAWRRVTGLGAIVAGLALLTGAVIVTWQTLNASPLYRYELDSSPQMAPSHEDADSLPAWRTGSVVAQEQGRRLATFEVAGQADDPVLMKWTPSVDAPFLTLLPDYTEISALAEVIQRHVPAGRKVMAWWDSSRQLRHLSGVDVIFGEHLGQPLFVPSPWKPWASSVQAIEQQFWHTQTDAAAQEQFHRFSEALLMDETEGMAQLRQIAGGQAVVLVLHIRDAILLGQLSPEKLGVAFREFSSTGDVHGSVSGVRDWLARHEYPAYTVMRSEGTQVRAVALADDESGTTLVARLLPFAGNAQHDVEGAQLVYRTGGFIVYEIAAEPAVSALAEPSQ